MTERVTAPTALDTLARCRDLVLPALHETADRLHPWLGQMAAFTLGWRDKNGAPRARGGGKALRPALAVLAAEAVGASAETAVAGAVAVELVHAFSLVHDDIIDGDEQRRHQDTVWKAFGVGPAVLAGDALLALALDALAHTAGQLPPATRSAALGLLSTSLVELVNGQAAVVTAMSLVGRDLGIAFQAVDDLLATPMDTPDAERTLRRAAALISEAGGRSCTTVQAHRHLDRALRTLHGTAVDHAAAAELTTLSEFIVNRTH